MGQNLQCPTDIFFTLIFSLILSDLSILFLHCIYDFVNYNQSFDALADSPRDSVQFIEWSPTSCPRALLIANFHGRITIWTQPSQVSQHCCTVCPSA